MPPKKGKTKAKSTKGKKSSEMRPWEDERTKRATDEAKAERERRWETEIKEFKDVMRGGEKKCETWCEEHVDKTYPCVGKVAYAVPPNAISQLKLRDDEETGLHVSSNASASESEADNSDARGRKAERRVERNFWILNNTYELNRSAISEPKRKPATMFIISNCVYEQMLKGIEQLPKDLRESKYFKTPKDAGVERRGADLILLHEEKGVIFIQVKSAKGNGAKKRIEEGLDQLKKDGKIFFKVMGNHNYHSVLALPNIETEQEFQELEIKEDELLGVELLLGQHLITSNIEKSEIESDVEKIKKWFEETLTAKRIDLGFLKGIIARYIGEFSTPYPYTDENELSQIHHLRDGIRLTAKLTKRPFITKAHKKVLRDLSDARVHVTGAPGSGRTTVLMKKAEAFLRNDTTNHVVVLDMYRGVAGRPAGKAVYDSVARAPSKPSCHHLQIDVLGKTDEEKSKLSCLRKSIPPQKNILFVIDEVLPEHYWNWLLRTIKTDFIGCQIWCADGLVRNETLTDFSVKSLENIVRIPKSVQRLLWHADWDHTRKDAYEADSGILPTEGPVPLSVRHKSHKSDKIIDCAQCAESLADLLKGRMKLVEEKLLCSIAILFSVPRERYQDADQDVILNRSEFDKYMSWLDRCDFIKKLRELQLPVKILTPLDEYGKDLEAKEHWDYILVSWVDWFQGLERDVVIFLPGDCSPPPPRSQSPGQFSSDESVDDPGTSRKTRSKATASTRKRGAELPSTSTAEQRSGSPRKIPVPGLDGAVEVRESGPLPKKRSRAASPSKEGLERPSTSTAEQRSSSSGEPSRKKPGKAASVSEENVRFSPFLWCASDVRRYSDWDQTNLVYTATRCTAQLILLVP